MKSYPILLAAVLLTESQALSQELSLLNRLPVENVERLGRALQVDTTCTLDALVAGICTFDVFCVNPEGSKSTIICQGEPTATWTWEVVNDETCYTSARDYEGFPPDSFTPLPEGAVCRVEGSLFTFEKKVLMNVTSSQIITAPYNTSFIVTYSIFACPDTEYQAFNFGEDTYCIEGCPIEASMDGTVCTGECTVCSDGFGVPNCDNLDPTLVYKCPQGNTDDDLYDELFAFLEKEESTDATPVATPTATETQKPILANEEPVQPVGPLLPTSTGAFISGRTMAAFAIIFTVLVLG